MMDQRGGARAPRPRRRLRLDLTAVVAMVVVAVVLGVVVLALTGSPRDSGTWPLLGLVALVIVLGAVASLVLVRRGRRGATDPTPVQVGLIAGSDRVATPEPPPSWDVIDADARWIELHPRPLWRRRLAEHPDALWLMLDREQMSVPGWLLEERPRTIDKLDRVAVMWVDIERFRVLPGRNGPDTYEITRRASATPRRWQIRRGEIHDELTLLDHARSVGGVTIELEDSISS